MEKLLQVNFLKTNKNQQEMNNGVVVSTTTSDQYSSVEAVISLVVEKVISQIKKSGFQFKSNKFDYFLPRNQVTNNCFDMIYGTNENDDIYSRINFSIQATVLREFTNAESKVTECKRVDDSNVNKHDETAHTRSFSRFFYLTIDGVKQKIEFCLHMDASSGDKAGISCRAMAVNDISTSVCIIS